MGSSKTPRSHMCARARPHHANHTTKALLRPQTNRAWHASRTRHHHSPVRGWCSAEPHANYGSANRKAANGMGQQHCPVDHWRSNMDRSCDCQAHTTHGLAIHVTLPKPAHQKKRLRADFRRQVLNADGCHHRTYVLFKACSCSCCGNSCSCFGCSGITILCGQQRGTCEAHDIFFGPKQWHTRRWSSCEVLEIGRTRRCNMQLVQHGERQCQDAGTLATLAEFFQTLAARCRPHGRGERQANEQITVLYRCSGEDAAPSGPNTHLERL
mmetsp:Transcript_67061/g.218315  ORF Transcript_67061/g.218315 Transcript_67061/m.218315 type:complete len:269 (-) Transcript_67061:120-926(-)